MDTAVCDIVIMPYKFQFKSQDQGPNQRGFACNLQCAQCSATARNGQQCKKNACIGVPFCWMHLLSQHNLRIKESSIPGAGKGLFAMSRNTPSDGIVFQKDQVICRYYGEAVTQDILQERYGDYTAPYGIHVRGTAFEDAGCKRGIGSLANHAPNSRANARYSYQLHNGSPVSFIRATKNIRNGSEVLVNYGRDYNFAEGTQQQTIRRRA